MCEIKHDFERMVDENIVRFCKELNNDSFKFYSEMEMYFQFCQLWFQNTGLQESVYRAFPTKQLYKDISGKLTKDENGKPGNIDICLRNGNKNYGIEMYIGRDTDEGVLKTEENRIYQLRDDSFNLNEFKSHLDRDITKLTDIENKIHKGYAVCLIRGWRDPQKRNTPGRRNEKYKRFFSYLGEAESYFREKIIENNLKGVMMCIYFDESMKRHDRIVTVPENLFNL